MCSSENGARTRQVHRHLGVFCNTPCIVYRRTMTDLGRIMTGIVEADNSCLGPRAPLDDPCRDERKENKKRRRWNQFSLRTLFLVTTAVAVLLGIHRGGDWVFLGFSVSYLAAFSFFYIGTCRESSRYFTAAEIALFTAGVWLYAGILYPVLR